MIIDLKRLCFSEHGEIQMPFNRTRMEDNRAFKQMKVWDRRLEKHVTLMLIIHTIKSDCAMNKDSRMALGPAAHRDETIRSRAHLCSLTLLQRVPDVIRDSSQHFLHVSLHYCLPSPLWKHLAAHWPFSWPACYSFRRQGYCVSREQQQMQHY